MANPEHARVLIIDDDLTVCLLAREALTQGGFTVDLAHSLEDATAAIRASAPDIILLDVQLPDGNGILYCSELRTDMLTAIIPILMVTGADDHESVLGAYGAGATDFMPKPLNWYLLLQRVRYMWRSSQLLQQSMDNERLLLQAQEMALVGSWERNLQTGEISTSVHFRRLFSRPEWSLKDDFLPFLDAVPAEEKSLVAEIVAQVSLTRVKRTFDHHIVARDGNTRTVRHTLEVRYDHNGQPLTLCGTIQDVTRDKLRSELEHGRNHILELALQNVNILDVYEALYRLLKSQIPGSALGVIRRTAKGWTCDFCTCSSHAIVPGEIVRLPVAIEQLLRGGRLDRSPMQFDLTEFPDFSPEHDRMYLLPIYLGAASHPDTTMVVNLNTRLFDPNEVLLDEVIQTLSGISAITLENYRLSNDLRYQAFHDSLTGLPNRFLFLDRLNHAVRQGLRNDEKLALIFMDLDRFKNTNDLLGHHFGDLVLAEVSARLSRVVRASDTLARMGGDEFMLISSPMPNYGEISQICDRIVQAMEDPIEVENYRINLGISMGVALFPCDGETPDLLYKHADIALHLAKKSSGSVKYFDQALMDQFMNKLAIENAMLDAMQHREFHLVYQPQVHARTGAVAGYEVLLRWQKADGTFISPANFIPIAEESGYIVPLGAWVLEEACREFLQLPLAKGDVLPRLSVNVSTLQFIQDDFPDVVQKVLKTTGFPADRLGLEITESALMNDVEIVIERLAAFRSQGISISIDDFGTGYSSMAYLRTLPIDCLKIDKCFIDALDAEDPDTKSASLVTALISLGESLELTVVAEGVETERQLEFLRSKKCDFIQGYLTGRPVRLADLK